MTHNLVHTGQSLHWTPQSIKSPETGERLYGAGVQYGKLFHTATQTIPRTGRVALMSLSWDGGLTIYQARSATPFCIQVMNYNGSSVDSVGHLGYLPCIEVSNAIKSTPKYKKASNFLLQVSLKSLLHLCVI